MAGKDDATGKAPEGKGGTISVQPFKYAAELYGKQIAVSQNDTVGKIKSVALEDGNKTIQLDAKTVGSFLEKFGLVAGATMLSFTKKQLGYNRTLVMNANEAMFKDGRNLVIEFDPAVRSLTKGMVIPVKDIVAMAAIVESALQESAKRFPPDVAKVEKSAKAADKTEQVEILLY